MWHRRWFKRIRHTPWWDTRRLLLGCFLILLLGAFKHVHTPHAALFAQADKRFQTHAAHYNLAPLPAKLQLRNDTLNRQTEKERLTPVELSTDEVWFSSAFVTLGTLLAHQVDLNRLATNDVCYCHAVLPPSRAPPSDATS